MSTSAIVLVLVQCIAVFAYRWVGRVFMSQPAYLHPPIFQNPAVRGVLVGGPIAILVVNAVLAFWLTDFPWLFLGLSIAAWVAFSVRPT